jgi:hypothetical protein
VQSKVKLVWKRKYRNVKVPGPVRGLLIPESSELAFVTVPADDPVSTLDLASACVPESSVKGLWTEISEEDICALDTEHVSLNEVYPGTDLKLVAGEVSIVNLKKEVIYYVSFVEFGTRRIDIKLI